MRKKTISMKERMPAPWASVIIVSSLLFVAWRSLSSCEGSTKKFIDEFRSNYFLPSAEERDEPMGLQMKRLILGQHMESFEAEGFTCQTEQNSEQCITSNQVRIQNKIIYISSSSGTKTANITKQMIKPYPLRDDSLAMQKVTSLQIQGGSLGTFPTCQYNHTVPAVVFSSDGFMENNYHALDEFLIPLFLTTWHFKSNFQFYITDFNPKVVYKYTHILKRLSKFEPIDSSTNGTSTHCFPGAVIGLNYHGNVAVNYSDTPSGYTMTDFRRFMYEAYNLEASDMELKRVRRKPVVVLLRRSYTRVLLNEKEVVGLMQEMGFQVHVALEKETSDLEQFARLLSKCDVLMGVHGAGLSNSVFLRDGAVLVQVLPLGLRWPGYHTTGQPAIRMGSRYVEYIIEPKESSLSETYSLDDPIISDPQSVFAKGYRVGRVLYLDAQNVTINLDRFKRTLLGVFHVIRASGRKATKVI